MSEVAPATELPEDVSELAAAAEREGFRFVARLIEEWHGGTNRFDAPDEAFFIARDDGRLAGICGVNADPYTRAPHVARLRHLYVHPTFRRRGIARALTTAAIAFARRARYTTIRLRTDTAEAAGFYEAVGFRRIAADEATHELVLEER